MKVGYVRVSTTEQNEERQTKALNEYGVEKMFIEKKSGKDLDRPVLVEMLEFCREGDSIIVSDISRLARNTKDLLGLVDELNKKGVTLISLKENIDFSSSVGKLLLILMASIYEFERSVMLERQCEGIAIAKEKGLYKGRKIIEKPVDFDSVVKMVYRNQITAVDAMKKLGLKKNTYYRLYNQWKDDYENVEIEL